MRRMNAIPRMRIFRFDGIREEQRNTQYVDEQGFALLDYNHLDDQN